MGRDEVRATGETLLEQAQALRAAFPDVSAMRQVPVAELPPSDGDASAPAALRYLRDEMLLVRDGRVGSLAVLDDEMACLRRGLGRLSDGLTPTPH